MKVKKKTQSVYYHFDELEDCHWLKKELPYDKLHVSIFLEDLKLFLLPFDKKSIEIKNLSKDFNLESISYLLSSKTRNISSAFRNFITDNHLIYYLLLYKKCYFEIIVDDTNRSVFQLINPYSVFNIGPKILQYIPKAVSERLDLPRILVLDEKKIFAIKLSSSLRRIFKNILKELIYHSNHELEAHQLQMDNYQNPHSGFDFRLFLQLSNIQLARITRKIGWNTRHLLKDELLEFYELIRFIRFQQCLSSLRECILQGINIGLAKTIKESNDCQLQYINLLSKDDLEQLKVSLYKGNLNFNDIRAPFY